MHNELTAKEAELRTVVDILDKKRKFISEVPHKIGVILDSASEVKSIFEVEVKAAADNYKSPI